MSEVFEDGGFILDTPDDIQAARLLTLKVGLQFEVKTGMQMTRGQSCYSIVKQEFKLKGNKKKVLEQFEKILRERGILIDK